MCPSRVVELAEYYMETTKVAKAAFARFVAATSLYTRNVSAMAL